MNCKTHDELVKSASVKYQRLGLDSGLDEISRVTSAFETSHIIVTYPSYQALAPIEPEDVGVSDRDLALYLHIPFCLNKCAYCHYLSDVGSGKDHRSYLKFLHEEIDLADKTYGLKGKKVHSIHFGGGTPTVLPTYELIGLLDKINSIFDVQDDAEITVESCPKSLIERITCDNFQDVQDHGVHRISVGIQSFNDAVLSIAQRKHTGDDAVTALGLARNAGFHNINVDLMVGLPGQTTQTLHTDLGHIAGLSPESITTYHLRLKSIVPMYDLLMKNSGYFPNPKTSLTMDLMIREYLGCLGYGEDPINWFNKRPEYKYRYQMLKWKNEADLLSFGPSAYSFINNNQYYNHLSLKDYVKNIKAGRLPIYVGKQLPPEEQKRRHIIFSLKIRDGIDKKQYRSQFKKEFTDEFHKKLKHLHELGLIEETNSRVRLTEKGLLFPDEIAKQFYSDEVSRKLCLGCP